jgi:hypothetical protein
MKLQKTPSFISTLNKFIATLSLSSFLKFFCLLSFIFLTQIKAHAIISLSETGEFVPKNQFKVGARTQFISGGTMNLVAHIDGTINESSNFRFEMGTGDNSFTTGFSYKLIPFPDYDQQPALGFKFGFQYARFSDTAMTTLFFTPLFSKKFKNEYGLFIPYAGAPIGISASNGDFTTPINLSAGLEHSHSDYPGMSWGGEWSMGMNQSDSYLGLYFNFLLDDPRTTYR